MREISVEEEFDRIMAIPSRESENEYRYRWFSEHYEGGNDMLDIGSGLGVWPYHVKASLGFNVQCVEPNRDCAIFLIDSLNIPCYSGFFIPETYETLETRFDVISFIHVLEHMDDPRLVLSTVKQLLRPHGKVFIEVPDSVEFDYLPIEHDEFNSTHLFFFDVPTLYSMLTNCGYDVTDIHRVYYEGRDLSRILMLCSQQ